MGSLSLSLFISKWVCLTLALLAVVLIEESLAYKCFQAEVSNMAEDKECIRSPPGGTICTTYFYHTGEKGKYCEDKKVFDEILNGENTCITGNRKDFEEKKLLLEEDDPLQAKSELEDWVRRSPAGGHDDPAKEVTVCACSTESCNTEANDDKLKKESKNKPKLNSKNSGGNRRLLADSGYLGAVMFLALAVLAALVPGSGFR